MTTKMVISLGATCIKYKTEAIRILEKIIGVDAVKANSENDEITVFGDVDPVLTFDSIRRLGNPTVLLSVGGSKDRTAQFNFTPASHDTSFASSTSASTSASISTSASTTSPSALITNSSSVYDVFISYRGPDNTKSFASHLYYGICRSGYHAFLDKEEMQGGENLTPQIEGAIRTASVSIAIFSRGYAESEWCLKELLLMLESRLESGATIIPVFYDVRPADLRWTREETVYGKALRALEQKKTLDTQTHQEKPRYDSNTIEKWRKALSDVAEISGFDMQACDGNEGQLAEKVIQNVLKKVRKTPLNVAKYPTGLDEKVRDFERKVLLQQESQMSRVIGIVGLGGIGKTTLAKEIFNRKLKNYKKSCSLLGVREKSLTSLQSKIIEEFAYVKKQIDDVDIGVEEIRNRLRQNSDPVLMLLDDVDHVKQLDALLVPVKDTLALGSLILITSRNKDALTNSGIVESCIYRQTGLNHQHSRELFCSHSFGQSCPVIQIEFEQLVQNFVSACGGLPLSLRVLGALLRGKGLEYWRDQLRRMSKILTQDIRETLKISYDALEEVDKQIFLDITCFFIGEERDTVIRICDASNWEGKLGLENLENRCLLEVDSENCIRMHDHLRDLGRYLAKEELQKGLRLWEEPNYSQLSDQSLVRGISMVDKYGSKWPEYSFKNLAGSRLITNMNRLQLLRAEGSCVESIFTAGQSPQLIWLCWYHYPYSLLPPWIPVKNLRVLEIEGSKFTSLWRDETQAPLQLRELIIEAIDASLLKFPKSIGKLQYLQKFVLHCNDYTHAVKENLPEEFCRLQSLEHLEIKNSKMKSLPQSFGKLKNLQCIHLSGFSNLEKLPDSFGDLTNLHRIHLSLSKLKMLPTSFGNLANLQHINLSRCFMLQMLPDSFGNFRNLQDISLCWCSKLKTLPESFGNLKNLQHIKLKGCSDLQTLPDIFGNLTKLRYIDLSWCKHLERPLSLEDLIHAPRTTTNDIERPSIFLETYNKYINMQCKRFDDWSVS